jgi:uncharacterized protein HemY
VFIVVVVVVVVVVVYFFIDSVRKVLDTPSYTASQRSRPGVDSTPPWKA